MSKKSLSTSSKLFSVCLIGVAVGLGLQAKPVFSYSNSHGIPPAIYTSWSGPNSPVGGYTGYDVGPLMNEVWVGEKTINWEIYEDQINKAQTMSTNDNWPKQPVSLILPPQNLDDGGDGTESYPFNNLFAPSWSSSLTRSFKTANHTYKTWDYGKLTPHATWFMSEAGKKFDQDKRIGVIRLYLGFQGETQPVKECQAYWEPTGGCQDTDPTAALKAFASDSKYCQEYLDYIFEVGKAAALAFPNKPVIAMAQTVGCPDYSQTKWRRELYQRWEAAGVEVGYSANSLAADWVNAEGYLPNENWSSWITYHNLAGVAPLSVETTIYPFWSPKEQKVHTYLAGLTAQSFGATSYFSPRQILENAPNIFFDDWHSYANNNRATVVFRDRAMPGQSWNGTDGASGLRGNLNINAQQLNTNETPQACGEAYEQSETIFNQISLVYKERACQTKMPVFSSVDSNADLYNWQARYAPTNGKFVLQSNASWTSGNMTKFRAIMATDTAGEVEFNLGGQSYSTSLPANTWSVYTQAVNQAHEVQIINKTAGKLYLHRVDWLRENGTYGDDDQVKDPVEIPKNPINQRERADINRDGVVDLFDYNILMTKLKLQ